MKKWDLGKIWAHQIGKWIEVILEKLLQNFKSTKTI
jgi:hypothetical protein